MAKGKVFGQKGLRSLFYIIPSCAAGFPVRIIQNDLCQFSFLCLRQADDLVMAIGQKRVEVMVRNMPRMKPEGNPDPFRDDQIVKVV